MTTDLACSVACCAAVPLALMRMHSFSGDPGVARQFLDRGAWLSFPGVVTFKNADALRFAAQLLQPLLEDYQTVTGKEYRLPGCEEI